MKRCFARERGVALITALLIVAVATTLAVSMSSDRQLEMRRNSNRLLLDQGWHYALGAEAWAARVLAEDRRDNDVDHPLEPWNGELPPMPIEGGSVAGRIHSQQGRCNLNNLLTGGQVNAVQLARFQRLLQVLDLDPALAEALLDWMDEDPESRPAGAESVHYLGAALPYRSADRALADVSELRLIRGFDAESVEALRPHVSALPAGSAINVNEASVEVLMSLDDGIGEGAAESLIADRGEQGYAKLDEFLQHNALAGLGLDPHGLDIGSNYFKVSAEIALGRSRLRFAVLLQRAADGSCQPLWRRLGEG